MKRELQKSGSFAHALKKTLKREPRLTAEIEETLELLSKDAFDPRLRTHKLKGKLGDSWACSAGYDLRIVFSFVEQGDAEAVLLETIGTHEEVY